MCILERMNSSAFNSDSNKLINFMQIAKLTNILKYSIELCVSVSFDVECMKLFKQKTYRL